MHIALYGGSFNPPHVAHQLSCAYVLATTPSLDALWMVPTFQHPFAKALAPYSDRVAMCEASARIFGGRVVVSRIEEELGGDSFTLRTVEEVKRRMPQVRLSLVVGADILLEKDRWSKWDELMKLVELVVIGRGALEGDRTLAMPEVSSTEVRARVARGDGILGLVDEAVARIIAERGLYLGAGA